MFLQQKVAITFFVRARLVFTLLQDRKSSSYVSKISHLRYLLVMHRALIAVLGVTFQQLSDQMFPTFDSLFLHENGPIFLATKAVQARPFDGARAGIAHTFW